jgi:hypothetical protein
MDHDALTDSRLGFGYARADGGDHAAGLVAADDGPAASAESQ